MSYKNVTHVLFDMDGLVLNTEDLYTQVFQEIAARYGKNYTYDVKFPTMGLQSDEYADAIIKALELPMSRQEFQREAKQRFQVLFPDTVVMPGARKLIQHLHDSNVPIGLATSSSIESYNLKVIKRHQELFALFPHKTWGSSDPGVRHGKPSPDVFLVAAAKFPDKPRAEQCLVFEDAVNGVRAALAAGMQVVMVPDPQLERRHTSEATLVLDSLEHFRPELFGLPPYRD